MTDPRHVCGILSGVGKPHGITCVFPGEAMPNLMSGHPSGMERADVEHVGIGDRGRGLRDRLRPILPVGGTLRAGEFGTRRPGRTILVGRWPTRGHRCVSERNRCHKFIMSAPECVVQFSEYRMVSDLLVVIRQVGSEHTAFGPCTCIRPEIHERANCFGCTP